MTCHNGWTNHETWNVSRWIGDEELSYNYWRERAQDIWDAAAAEGSFTRSEQARYTLAYLLKDETEKASPLGDAASMYADLLGAAFSNVNWSQVANGLLDGLDIDEYKSDAEGVY